MLYSLPGCQYRMTSYDDDVDRSDRSPAYGLHLHDPRLLEYVGAPELAHLLSRSPEYWLHHMGWDKTVSAALQLQHDEGIFQDTAAYKRYIAQNNMTSILVYTWRAITRTYIE